MEEEHLDETIQKPKKPRSEKQLLAFEKAREKRVENAKIKKEKINEIKEKAKKMQLIDDKPIPEQPEQQPEQQPEPEKQVIKKQKKKPKTTIIYESDSSDTDEELVIVKKKKEKKQISQPQIPEPAISKIPVIKFI